MVLSVRLSNNRQVTSLQTDNYVATDEVISRRYNDHLLHCRTLATKHADLSRRLIHNGGQCGAGFSQRTLKESQRLCRTSLMSMSVRKSLLNSNFCRSLFFTFIRVLRCTRIYGTLARRDVCYSSVSVCPSVSSRYCIETTAQVELVFGMTTQGLSHTV